MARYFITLQFDGTNYHGWQIQPNGNTVEETIERALSTLMGESVDVVGAGRTDAGVHAGKMVAHFDAEQAVDCEQLVYKLNRMLPKDIAIQLVEYPFVAVIDSRGNIRFHSQGYRIGLAEQILRHIPGR